MQGQLPLHRPSRPGPLTGCRRTGLVESFPPNTQPQVGHGREARAHHGCVARR